jgi:outer membrane biosynthesis protein TonB
MMVTFLVLFNITDLKCRMFSIILAMLLQQSAAAGIVPAKLAKAVAPLSPANMVAGTCVLADVPVNRQGRVGTIKILRGLGSPFIDSATTAIKQWEFTGAVSGDKGDRVASHVGVFTVFRPATFGNQGMGGPEFGYKEPDRGAVGSTHPPYPRTFKDPEYPMAATSTGVVIIEVTINKLGMPSNIRTIQEVPALTNVARNAISSWIFMPAFDSGKPVDGTLIVAMSFVRPAITN